MDHTKELLSIDLALLVPSPHNVRRHGTGPIEELAALIASQGLLHPLIVTEQMSGRGRARTVMFAVVAGERRRRALLLLQRQGRLPAGYEVRCELVTAERAVEVSVAENSGREPMHPADEFEAFKRLVEEGKGVEDVAARFGVSPLTVRRRLKLSAVSPKLLTLYRQDGLNLDQLMALALSDDHETQERAWFGAAAWDRTPAALRRTLTAGEVAATTSPLARFVGVDRYQAAGGTVRRDLFDDEDSRFLGDAELLARLAAEVLDTLAVAVRAEGWAWVESRLDLDHDTQRAFGQIEPALREPTVEERAVLSDLEIRERELEREAAGLSDEDDGSADAAERIELEEESIAQRRRAIEDGRKHWPPMLMQHAGAIITIDREGEARVVRGLVREADKRAVAAALGAENANRTNVPDAERHGSNGSAKTTEGSESLLRRLAAHRTLALQATMIGKPNVTLAALTLGLAQQMFSDPYLNARPVLQVAVRPSTDALRAVADDLGTSRAWASVESAKQGWQARLPDEPEEWFEWLLALPQAELVELLGLCAALTVNALPASGAREQASVLAEAVGLDMADWWEPTPEGYLNHVPKAKIVEALKQAKPSLSHEWAGGLKKSELVAQAAVKLAGTRWLPTPLKPIAA